MRTNDTHMMKGRKEVIFESVFLVLTVSKV